MSAQSGTKKLLVSINTTTVTTEMEIQISAISCTSFPQVHHASVRLCIRYNLCMIQNVLIGARINNGNWNRPILVLVTYPLVVTGFHMNHGLIGLFLQTFRRLWKRRSCTKIFLSKQFHHCFFCVWPSNSALKDFVYSPRRIFGFRSSIRMDVCLHGLGISCLRMKMIELWGHALFPPRSCSQQVVKHFIRTVISGQWGMLSLKHS